MRVQGKIGSGLFVFLLALAGGGAAALAAPAGTPTAGAAARLPATPVAQAGSVRSTQALPAALRPVFYQALAKDAGTAYAINKDGCAALPKQPLKACFDSTGAHFTLPAGQAGGTTPMSLHLVAWGRGNDLASITAVQPAIKANEASYAHGNLTEWWRVLPVGFEQRFTIAKRPAGHGELTLALAMSRQDACLCVSACLRAARRQARRQAGAPGVGAPTIRHSRAGGNPVEKDIPTNGRDTNAYWIPAFAGMTNKKNGNTLAWGKLRYGQLVVTDARGKVVPATLTTKGGRILIAVNDAHAVYPLTVDPLVWLEQKVAASDGATLDDFGYSVAVSGATALVGAPIATVNGNSGQGAAYVFGESGGSWTQTAKLTASDGAAGDFFGSSVALSGTTALVGAPNATVNSNGHQGAAYVFGESDGNWTQTQKLTANDGAANVQFGDSVALSGTTALVGAHLSNGTQGAAYVFGESDGNWTQTAKLTASDGAEGDQFGTSVALSGTTALVGAPYATVNGNSYQGAAYVFTESSGTWTQTAKLAASDGADDAFGNAVALSGTTALVGAPSATVNGNSYQGAAYVFGESGGSWTQTQKLSASDGAADDVFGTSVALDGTTALVGAAQCGDGNCIGPGAAYVFTESSGTWTQTAKLTASDGAAGNLFGYSVALDGNTALVGASQNANGGPGAAYFEGESDLGLAVSAPQSVTQGQQYVSQTIATNSSSAASPAVNVTVTVPAAASLIAAGASQGSCTTNATLVTCNLGSIAGNAGMATVNVFLKAVGAPGATIKNTATVTKATPPLTAGAPTEITASVSCPAGYTEYDGSLNAGFTAGAPPYQAPAGEENAILTAPTGFQLVLVLHDVQGRKSYAFPSNAVHRHGPAGTYRWLVRAKSGSGAYTLCILHP